MPPLPADSIHARACKLKCEKILTRPWPAWIYENAAHSLHRAASQSQQTLFLFSIVLLYGQHLFLNSYFRNKFQKSKIEQVIYVRLYCQTYESIFRREI